MLHVFLISECDEVSGQIHIAFLSGKEPLASTSIAGRVGPRGDLDTWEGTGNSCFHNEVCFL
jgi:hypothetical protein